ncbi:MAG: prepilin-type N-terminal cleavage/methylation domain-containing protein [Candidatus Riflebacteria bacterium]|nr:prepilin-type N-terminal cleavage/methylation domain-containing protein [Candidatus Riflebacteria bacterium]
MNRKGFTLMELLLVVAVLAIVAAAAAPTFFGGAQDAMNEAKKASFMSAYQNAMSGANIMTSIAASKGVLPADDQDLTSTALDGKKLNDYAPLSARIFKNRAGTQNYAFGIYYKKATNTESSKVVAFYNTIENTTTEPTYAAANEIADPNDATNGLEKKWKTINGDN